MSRRSTAARRRRAVAATSRPRAPQSARPQPAPPAPTTLPATTPAASAKRQRTVASASRQAAPATRPVAVTTPAPRPSAPSASSSPSASPRKAPTAVRSIAAIRSTAQTTAPRSGNGSRAASAALAELAVHVAVPTAPVAPTASVTAPATQIAPQVATPAPQQPQWSVLAHAPTIAPARPPRVAAVPSGRPQPAVPVAQLDLTASPRVQRVQRAARIPATTSASRDGLTDTWPGEASAAGRWWWTARDAAGRLLADLRQGRLRLPRPAQPRLVLGLLIALGIVLAVSGAGLLLAQRYAGAFTLPGFGPGADQPTSGIVLQNPPGGAAPSVAVPPFALAAWADDSAPSSYGQVHLLVRVTNTSSFAPQPGVPVGLAVAFTCATDGNVQRYGPTATDGDGLATFTVSFANLPVGQPVCVTASAQIGGQTYTTTATFAASGAWIAPTPVVPFPTPPRGPCPKKHPCWPPISA